MKNNDIDYYKGYYDQHRDASYLGEKAKHTSRMLVFKEWLRKELKPGAKILDVGCGDGIFADLMPEFEWYGVDINTEKVRGRIQPERLASADLMKPPYPWEPGTFDAIICSEVLEHLWDLRVVHKEAKRLLKREGLYIISTPNFDWITNHMESFRRIMQTKEAHWSFEHIRHLNKDTHEKFLNECGFVVESHTGADAHYCPVFANTARAIRDGLRGQGVEIDENLIHKWIGDGAPQLQHTVILSARKA